MQQVISYLVDNPTALYIAVGLFSLCIGSFLNVVIFRTPKMMEQEWHQECQMLLHPEQPIIDEDKLTLSKPASTCPKCHSPIRWYQNIPVISWLVLRGKCGTCQNPISIRYPFIELLTMVCSLIVAVVFGATIQMLLGLLLTWVLITLTFIDFDTQLLPDRFTLPLAALGLGINTFTIYTSPSSAIWGYLIGFLCLWIVYYLFKLITGKEGMGYGDFKLLAALGAWMGPMMLPLIILLSSVVGAIIGIILMKMRGENQPFAFGPYIAIAGWIAFLWGDQIMKVYLGG
ncbi:MULTISPECIES: A24 family peptidase [Acinetobacter]|jgi:leader peptidase (prepilin peptidase)/N-methyltransferase|uniref:prepilin peptidase n=1 Tax=Acinetobacter TaxID=469 RepID=UPI000C470D73|nr:MULTISPECIES: A24 family peptidase [Acinetobacter]MBC69910.1 prepilin peptidase [Acinetobacter sp.]MBT49442.1 prepilin peptidase [Acinetobacter sp.]HIQ34931.1 prepilin peptidase [Acinetobacter venetianus]HJP46682.1 A24 family peptidase [Acinetobacter venetianus]